MTLLTKSTFLDIFNQEILPIYKEHERSFDTFGFHGQRHIARTLLLAEAMANYYENEYAIVVDKASLWGAVAFHDSGRKKNGEDYWEVESAHLCQAFLVRQGTELEQAKAVANSILKKKKNIESITDQLVYDADVLDIMRLFVDSEKGIEKFRKVELLFLSETDIAVENVTERDTIFRQALVEEAWKLIFITEKRAVIPNDDYYLNNLLTHIENNLVLYPRLSSYLLESKMNVSLLK